LAKQVGLTLTVLVVLRKLTFTVTRLVVLAEMVVHRVRLALTEALGVVVEQVVIKKAQEVQAVLLEQLL
jgi:hypothetical protein